MVARPISPEQSVAIHRVLGPLLIAIVGFVMVLWTWGRWPDVLIDFGRELYVPWRLTQGNVLYRDIAYFNGPLSPYFNALMFSLLGVGIKTLVLANLLVIVLIVAMLYRLLADLASVAAATTGAIVFLVVFAFGQYEMVGSANYVCPYSHELTHGLALSLAALCFLRQHLQSGRRGWLFGVGAALGAVWLTKPEVFAAAALAVLTGLAFAPRRGWSAVGIVAAATAMAPLLAAVVLCSAYGWEVARRGLLGAWPYVLDERLRGLSFYQSGMGTDDPARRLLTVLGWLGRYSAVLLPAVTVAFVWRHRLRWPASSIVFLLSTVMLLAFGGRIPWIELPRPLPFVIAAMAAAWGLRGPKLPRWRWVLGLVMCVFSVALLTKMILAARLNNYGFVLAMPAILLSVVALLDWVPAWIGRRGGNSGLMRTLSAAVIFVAAGSLLAKTHSYYQHKTIPVATGPDRFWAGPRGDLLNALLSEIDKQIHPEETIAALPEGVMINYLCRRANPTPYINLMPLEVLMFGSKVITGTFQSHPPDFVFLVHKDTAEYGPRFFGRDYHQDLWHWLWQSYERVDLIGAEPFLDDRVGIIVMRRKDKQ